MPTDHDVEVEWQFDVEDHAPVERWLADLPNHPPMSDGATVIARAKPPKRLTDHYLDTADWRIALAGLVLRTRRKGVSEEATLKDTRPASPDGLRRRLEVTEPLGEAGLGGLGSAGPVGGRLSLLVGSRALRQVMEIHTRRQPFSLRVGDEEIGEVALDDTTIIAGPEQRPRHLRRVELEVVADWVDRLEPMVSELRRVADLIPATLSKYETGLEAAGLTELAFPTSSRRKLDADCSIADLVRAVIDRYTSAVVAKEPGTRLGEDPEDLHDMRVAVRKLRAAFSLFKRYLPPRCALVEEDLAWLCDLLGAVRDIDVQSARLGDLDAWLTQWASIGHDAAVRALSSRFDARRSAGRYRLLVGLDDLRYERLLDSLRALAHDDGPEWPVESSERARDAMSTLAVTRHRSALKAARTAKSSRDPMDRHRLRIRIKRLRYAIEFAIPLYGKVAQRYIEQLSELQDRYGALQDAAVAVDLLSEICAEPGGEPFDPKTVFALGTLAEHYRDDASVHLDAEPTPKEVLEGRRWRELYVALKTSDKR